jgi:hypothetical protein
MTSGYRLVAAIAAFAWILGSPYVRRAHTSTARIPGETEAHVEVFAYHTDAGGSYSPAGAATARGTRSAAVGERISDTIRIREHRTF